MWKEMGWESSLFINQQLIFLLNYLSQVESYSFRLANHKIVQRDAHNKGQRYWRQFGW